MATDQEKLEELEQNPLFRELLLKNIVGIVVPKVKIVQEGQLCRHCQTPVFKKVHTPDWKPKARQPYYYAWWFVCPKKECGALYMVEEAKVHVERDKAKDIQPQIFA